MSVGKVIHFSHLLFLLRGVKMKKICAFNCSGELSSIYLSKDFNNAFNQRITIINIPFELCSGCKMIYYNSDTKRIIETILSTERTDRIVYFENEKRNINEK